MIRTAIIIALITIVIISAIFLIRKNKTEKSYEKFQKCPASPNCVSSKENITDVEHYISPITYEIERERSFEKIKEILNELENVKIVEENDLYIHAVFVTTIMRFKDDVEFQFLENEKIIHIRSASRIGHSDLGLNRKRMEKMRSLFNEGLK